MRCPAIRDVCDVVYDAKTCSAGLSDGRYVPARPYEAYSLWHRLKATWLVWTGRADAVTCPGQ
jgi:hypothetical protein